MTKERAIEVKVGLLILVSFIILGGFILVMGGMNLEKTFTVFVDFDNPGGLQSGAAVKIGGVKVGKVQALEFLGGKVDSSTGRRPLVRVKIAIEERARPSVHDDADFYVTTQGVLGEQFLAIDPGSADHPVLAESTVVKGIDPPRLDLFLAKSYELLDTTVNGIRNNRELIRDLAVNASVLLKNTGSLVADNRDRLQRTLENVESLSAEASGMAKEARVKYVQNPKIERTINNVDDLVSSLHTEAPGMVKDARDSLANLRRISSVVSSAEDEAKLRKAIDDIEQVASRAKTTSADAQAIVTHIKTGKGTIGALVMDEQVYDDIQELLRDLKHNPWKVLWKE